MESQVRLRGARSGPRIAASSESILNSTSGGYDSNEGDNIKVYVRIRPPAKFMTDVEMDQSVCLDVTSPNSLTILSKPEPKVFTYDHVASMETTQEEVFSIVGKGIIEAFVAGFNGTIFAYGQTGSGKTFTMLGPPDDESDNFSHELRGVIPRGFEYLFSLINREQEKAGSNIEFLARCSFLEIYNEQIYDLLDAASIGLHLREDIKKGVFVEGLRECDVSSAKDAYSVLQSGWQNRRVASTSMNRESSRSHAVFTVLLESKFRKGGTSNIKVSKLHLVDLAGSERQKDTHAVDVRLKEAGSINKSLSALGNVIMALVDIAHGKKRHIHYRDSKLTFILRDSLGGNAKTHIIANVHPSSRCFGETLSTLQFARRAKMIKNKAVVNEDVVGNVIELQAEIRRLKEQLAQSRAGIQVDAKTVAESSLENSSIPVSIPRGAAFAAVDDGLQWKEMMLSAISERDRSEEEKQALQEKVQKLEELCTRKEKFLQSTKMILKFRETTIKKLERIAKKEKGTADEEDDSKDKEIQLLREEIKLMQDKIDHHPDVTRFATENLELRAEIKRLKAIDPSNGEFTQDMAKAHRYTLQLERQLRELMTGQGRELEKSLSSSQQSLEASNIELDKIKLELVQVQAKLCSTQTEMEQYRQSLQQKREELINKSESYRIKELELQSEVSALRKSNNDLERALESLQLKTAVERTAMNSLHMQTIKTITSPRRFGTPRTTSRNTSRLWASPKLSTPKLNLEKASQNQELPSTPADNAEVLIGDEPMPAGLLRKDSLNGSSDEEEVQPFWAEFNNETRDDEIVYMEALQNELKSLQDLYSQSLKAFHVEQSKHIHLSQTATKLEHQLTELNELLTKERSVWRSAEAELTNQLTSVRDKYKEVQSNSTILKSEVDDLRVMLSSADKQLDAMKKDRHEEMIDASRKCAAVESRLVKMEVEFLNLQAEMDATAESNNNLQCELETCKDELEFFRHKNRELEEIIGMERAKNTEAEERLQGTLERLQYEMEMNLKLGQDDKQDELIRSVETINSLRSELHDLQKKYEEQEKACSALTADLEQSRADCAAQKWLNITDKKSLENLVKQVQDLRATLGEKESNVACLTSELEDIRQSYKELESRLNEKKSKIQKLNDALKTESDKAARERSDREAETLALKEEIGAANRQIEELSQTLEQQQSQLQSLQGDHLQIKVEMADRMNQITSLEEQLVSTHATHESVLKELQSGSRCVDESIFVSNQIELEAARENLDRFAKLSVDWEQSRLSDRDVISALQRRCSEFEILHSDRELLEDRIRVLELELDTEKDLKSEKTMALMRELESARAESDRHYAAFHSVNVLKEEEGQARLVAEQKLKELEMNLFNAQEDVDSLQEELDRVKAMEEKVFKEKEDLKTQMAIANEEKAKLVQKIGTLESSCEKLIEENAKLAGHQNLRQKIQTLMDIKRENQELKQELDLVAKECSCNSYERISKELRMVRDKESGRDKEGKKKPLGSRNCQSGSSVLEKRQVSSDSSLIGKENQSLDL